MILFRTQKLQINLRVFAAFNQTIKHFSKLQQSMRQRGYSPLPPPPAGGKLRVGNLHFCITENERYQVKVK